MIHLGMICLTDSGSRKTKQRKWDVFAKSSNPLSCQFTASSDTKSKSTPFVNAKANDVTTGTQKKSQSRQECGSRDSSAGSTGRPRLNSGLDLL